jgi:hypothetical protein
VVLKRWARALEILGGAEALPERLAKRRGAGVALGAWWAFLFLLVLAFAGRATKFVYVDF